MNGTHNFKTPPLFNFLDFILFYFIGLGFYLQNYLIACIRFTVKEEK